MSIRHSLLYTNLTFIITTIILYTITTIITTTNNNNNNIHTISTMCLYGVNAYNYIFSLGPTHER